MAWPACTPEKPVSAEEKMRQEVVAFAKLFHIVHLPLGPGAGPTVACVLYRNGWSHEGTQLSCNWEEYNANR